MYCHLTMPVFNNSAKRFWLNTVLNAEARLIAQWSLRSAWCWTSLLWDGVVVRSMVYKVSSSCMTPWNVLRHQCHIVPLVSVVSVVSVVPVRKFSSCSSCRKCSSCSSSSKCSSCSRCKRCSKCSSCSKCSKCSICSSSSMCSKCSSCSFKALVTVGYD